MTNLHRVEFGVRLMQTGDKLAKILFQIRRIEHTLKRSFIDRHSGVFIQRRFRVEGFHLGHPAHQKDPDDALGFGRHVSKSGRQSRCGRF